LIFYIKIHIISNNLLISNSELKNGNPTGFMQILQRLRRRVLWQAKRCGAQRYRCKPCNKTFKTEYIYRAREPGVKEQVAEMALNGSGVRDTGRVLGIAKGTVIATLKKSLRDTHHKPLCRLPPLGGRNPATR
jgi:transposase-like protein